MKIQRPKNNAGRYKFIVTLLLTLAMMAGPFTAAALPVAAPGGEEIVDGVTETEPLQDNVLDGDDADGNDASGVDADDDESPAGPVPQDPVQPGDSLKGYELVAADRGLELYTFHVEGSQGFFEIAVKETASGKVWHSSPVGWDVNPNVIRAKRQAMGSMLIVDYIDKVTRLTGSANSLVASVRKKGLEVDKIAGGVRVTFNFTRPREKFSIPVEFTISDGKFNAVIDYAGIDESESNNVILNIKLLPFFGAGPHENDGYILIPDGCGALMNFGAGKPNNLPYEQQVYGREPILTTYQDVGVTQPVNMPVFGMKDEDAAFFAIIKEGAALASVAANPSGINGGYNAVNANFTYRRSDEMIVADKSLQAKPITMLAARTVATEKVLVEYHFLYNDNANYMGMAKVYRDYLTDSAGLGLAAKATAGVPFYMDVYGAVKKKQSVLGFVVTGKLPMTTFSQTKEMLESLGADGVTDTVVRYKGWQTGGLQDTVNLKARAEGKLGGKSGLKKLSQYADENNASLYLDSEFLQIHKSRWGWWPFNYASKDVSKKPAAQNIYKVSTFVKDTKEKPSYLMSPNKLTAEVDSFAKSFDRLGLAGAGLAPSSFSTMVYGNYAGGKSFTDREEGRAVMQQNLETLQKASNGTMALDAGFDYTLPFAGHLFNTPLFDSGFDVATTDVPFYQIVLHGLLNYAAPATNLSEDPVRLFLRELETGTAPSFTFTWEDSNKLMDSHYEHLLSTQFSVWRQNAVETYLEYAAVYQNLNDKTITNHEIITENVRITTFSNGAKIFVNYGSSPYSYRANQADKPMVIPANGYLTKGV